MEWYSQGHTTYKQRHHLFLTQRQVLEEEIEKMNKTLDMLRFKCWYYEQALKDGNEDELNKMLPDKLPSDIQALYDRAHEI